VPAHHPSGPASDPVVRRFAALVARPPEAVPLDEAAILLGAVPRRACDVDGTLVRLDELGRRVREAGGDLAALRLVLFEQEGFVGDRRDYGAAVNSYLDAVLDRRRGLPITLAVLALEVGRRSGVDLVGIGMPGHFLVREAAPEGWYVDVFDGGRLLDRAGCQDLHGRVRGGAPLPPGGLDPVDTHAILARMLNNLTAAAARTADSALALRVALFRVELPDAGPAERVALARALGAAGRFLEAAELLEDVAVDLDGSTAADLRTRATALRARLN